MHKIGLRDVKRYLNNGKIVEGVGKAGIFSILNTHFPLPETERLHLRELRHGDALFAICSNPAFSAFPDRPPAKAMSEVIASVEIIAENTAQNEAVY